MKNLNKILILASIFATLAAVGCSSAPKNEEHAQVSQSAPSSPVDLGASSAGRGR